MKLFQFWKPVLIGLIILYGSLTSGSKLPDVHLFDIKHFDKIIHFLLYMTFTITLYGSLLKLTHHEKKAKILIALLISFIYGLLMESFQYMFTSDRSPEFLDILANLFGSIVAIAIYPLFVKLNLHKYL